MSAGRLLTAATRHNIQLQLQQIIKKSLDPSRTEKIFIRKKLDHTTVSAITASSVNLYIWQKEPGENTAIFNKAVVSKPDISRKIPKYFKFVYKKNLNV